MEHFITSGQNRITPPDLASGFLKDFVEGLATRWASADLMPEWFWNGEKLPQPVSYLYLDYLHTIGTLLLTTQDVEATRQLVLDVLAQAEELGKSSLWVEDELKFEGMVHGADRDDFLRLDLEQTATANNNVLDDATLDRYNERISRFANTRNVTPSVTPHHGH